MRPTFFSTILRAICFLLAALLLLPLCACSGGLPATASAARKAIRSLGFENEITFEEYAAAQADGRKAVLLYADANAESFFQAVLYDSEEHARAAYGVLLDDDLLAVELENGNRILNAVGKWVVIGPEEAVRAFSGGPDPAVTNP
ncbi:MAG: hypothetical protein J5843_01650 [Clostridia bacterium]|nr:hypothetical protein [Clostridia bacterium]